MTYKDLIIYGESFWLIEGVKKDPITGTSGRPHKARRLHPMYMDARILSGEVVGWRYGPIFESEDEIKYDLNEVVQFKIEDPDSDIYGLSLLDSLQRTVATDLHAMKFNEKFFENSASSGLILGMKGATKEEIERNREWLEQNYVGPENAHRPMLLEGEITVDTSIRSPQEMQFIEGRKFNRQEILALMDVDPSKLGINENANRSVAKEADNSFRSETISPLQTIVEEEISNTLILEVFGFDDVLFEQEESSLRDRLALLETFAIGERMGVFSVNRIIKELGGKPIEGGDAHFIQTAAGLIPVAMVDEVAMRLITTQTGGQINPGTGLGTDDNPPGTGDDF
jgi:phage portal protein BeeE